LEKFLEQMTRVMQRWPDYAQWSVSQLVDYTHFPAQDVVAWMSFGTKRHLETDSRLSYGEAVSAIAALQAAHDSGSHIKATPKGSVATHTRSLYEQVMSRNHQHLQNKDWRRAYLNLVHFLNQHRSELPIDVFSEALSECLRLAGKAEANSQEVFAWLETGVKVLTEDQTKAGVTEAIDFIDAYGDILLPTNSGLVERLFETVRPLALKHNMITELEEIRSGLLAARE
jgi:hypothetical protein